MLGRSIAAACVGIAKSDNSAMAILVAIWIATSRLIRGLIMLGSVTLRAKGFDDYSTRMLGRRHG